MRRISLTALLAVPLLLVAPDASTANPPRPYVHTFGLGGYCNFGSKLHQHGPLFNYGPYYGYPPFEPYGPWNAYLQYNPWYYGDPAGYGNGGHGGHAFGGRLGGLFHRGCDTCGGEGLHRAWLHGGWFQGRGCTSCGRTGFLASHTGWVRGHTGGCSTCGHGFHGLKGRSTGCSTCGGFAVNADTTDAVTRYAGAGNAAEFAGFYSALPTIVPVSGN